MPIARFQLPDGRIAKFEVPEGTTPEQAQAEIEKHLASVPKPAQESNTVTEAELVAGSPLARFAMGAASPVLGAAQLGAEAFGDKSGTDTLKQLEEMKKRGMSSAAELIRLKRGREIMSRLPGYEAQLARVDQQIAELEKQNSATDGGFDLAGLAGTVISPPVLAATKIPMAGTTMGRVGQGAALGAGLGAASPVTSGDDFWSTKGIQTAAGAAIGGVIPPVVEGVTKVSGLARRLLDPKAGASKILSEAAGDKRAAIEDALEQSIYVPGSKPTAAEAATPAGSPTFSALQSVARQKFPEKFSDIASEQAGVRLGLIQSFAKDKEAVQAATQVRNVEGKHNYGNVQNFLVRMDEEIGKLLDRPSMAKAVARAEELAKEEGKALGADVGSLHRVKMALDDMLTNPERFGIGASEARAIGQTRSDFLNWLTKKAPLYEKARAVYAEMSKPINEMKVGQGLERALTKPIGEGERAGVFAQAMRDEPGTIKKATGQPRFNELEDVLSPENLAKAKTVLADLARKSEQERLASLGRSRATEITGMPNPLPGVGPFQQEYTTIRAVLSRITKGVTDKTIKEVADAIAVPENALRLLRNAPDKHQQQLLDQILAQKFGRGAIAAGTEMATQ